MSVKTNAWELCNRSVFVVWNPHPTSLNFHPNFFCLALWFHHTIAMGLTTLNFTWSEDPLYHFSLKYYYDAESLHLEQLLPQNFWKFINVLFLLSHIISKRITKGVTNSHTLACHWSFESKCMCWHWQLILSSSWWFYSQYSFNHFSHLW